MDKLKHSWSYNLDSENYNNIVTDSITFNRDYKISASSWFLMNEDFEGNIVNNLKPTFYPKVDLRPTYLTIFPQNNKTEILFSYHRKHRNYFNFFREQVSNLRMDLQKSRISKLIIYYVENLFISPKKWNSLENNKKKHITKTFLDSMPDRQDLISIQNIQDIDLFID